MSTGNPLEQLRRRMHAHVTPAAFAALAEEHRRAGRLAEAIAVCRDGLACYPAYVSARVTLGRALLDSGDASSAVAELEHAVAQAPDNLAAARALESAHDALGSAPAPPSRPPLTDLPLHATDGGTVSIPSSVVGEALAAAADGPQAFGLRPEWSSPDTPSVAADVAPAASVPEGVSAEDGDPLAWFAQTDAPPAEGAPGHAPGDEPTPIWCVPIPTGEANDATAGERLFSWAPEPPAGTGDTDSGGHLAVASIDPAPVPIIEAPVMDLHAADTPDVDAPQARAEAVDRACDRIEAPDCASVAQLAPAASSAAADAADDVDPQTSPFWTGVFGGEPEPGTPPPFAGWGEDPPATAPGADRSPWPDQGVVEPTDAWAVPDGPSAAWALAEPPAAARAPSLDVAWAGSVKSALGEVFALAGQGESREPPPHASDAVCAAMADAAVEAAVEDVAVRDDAATPALASLQQMLDAVRARRAALFHDVQS